MGPPKNTGFPEFLAERMGAPGVNLRAFREDVQAILRSAHLTLVDSGASASLVAALTLAERCGIPFHRGGERPAKHRALASGFAHPSMISALFLAGFDVTLVDTEKDGFNVSPDAVASAITDDVALVCVTHFLGFPARIDLVADAAAGKRVTWILQDASDTLGLRVAGYPIHAWASLTTYSFDHERHLSTYGGGAIATDDKGLAIAVDSIATGGNACIHDAPFYEEDMCEAPPDPDHRASFTRMALSVPMSDLDASYGSWSLESQPSDQRRRAVHYGVFYETLSQHPKLAVYADPFSGSTPFVFPIRVRSGDARPLAERLLARGVEVHTTRGGAIADQPAFARATHDGLPSCRAMTNACLVLSIHPSLKTEDVEQVAEIVAEEGMKV